jgi:hypothetical protein
MTIKWSDDAMRLIKGEPRETPMHEPMKLKDLPPGSYELAVFPEDGGLPVAAVSHGLPSWIADGKLFVVLHQSVDAIGTKQVG